MNLEDEKRLVAEWMGWKYDEGVFKVKEPIPPYEYFAHIGEAVWNPQSERKWWPKIWDKFTWSMIREYDKYLTEMAYENSFPTVTGGFGAETELALRWKAHRAKPEVCWKALVKSIKEAE